MRVIAGSAKGRKLFAPKGIATRPALAKVKEAIFDILGPLSDELVLDLFAGSGAIGIEALSRGARKATFVENNRSALSTLHRNLEVCRFAEDATVISLPVERALQRLHRTGQQFDLIFVDPPYDQNQVQPTLEHLEKVLADRGIIIVESSPREGLAETTALRVTDRRKYGQTRITFLQHRKS